MRVLVSGAAGLIGSALIPRLEATGHRVTALVRPSSSARAREGKTAIWDPPRDLLNPHDLEMVDGIVHLAGEPIVGRWTRAKKARILESRAAGTTLLCKTLASLPRPPRVLLCASAIGYYGDRGQEVLREESAKGSGFLSDVCQAWEAATQPAVECGMRVVRLRFGIVLSLQGGALAKMLPAFRLGLGGVVGWGRQYWSWIAIADVVEAILHILTTETLRGPVNLVAPEPVTNAEFTRALGRILKRPTPCPVPTVGLRLLFGEMADALLLSSARVLPRRLEATRYPFRFPDLDGALHHLLTPPPPSSLPPATPHRWRPGFA